MPRSINNFVFEGNGFRVTWTDGRTDQYIWTYSGGSLYLSVGGIQLTSTKLDELLDNLNSAAVTSSAMLHLLGGADEHLEACATDQANVSLAQNTWVRLIYNALTIESHSHGLSIDTSTGIITLPYGEWRVTASTILHDSSGNVVPVFIHLYDEDAGAEIEHTFVPSAKVGSANAPVTITTRRLIKNTGSSMRISVRARTTSNGTQFGVHSTVLPEGSTNTASKVAVERAG